MFDDAVISRRTLLASLAALAALPRPSFANTTGGANAIDAFGAHMLDALNRKATDTNLVLSPLNLHAAMTMLALGGDEATQTWLLSTPLGGNSKAVGELSTLHASARAQAAALKPPGAELTMLNTIWTRQQAALKDAYKASLGEAFPAESQGIDFAAPETPATINAWVAKATSGKIDKIVEQTSADTVLLIASALYFKGLWSTPFDAAKTQPLPFTLASGKQIEAPAMRGLVPGGILQQDGMTAIEIAYGSQAPSPVRFRVLMGAEGAPLKDLRHALNTLSSARFEAASLKLELPKFTAAMSKDMDEALRAIGMERLFDTKASRFANITGEDIGTPKVVHAARVEVDETGTVAAAATTVTGTRSAEVPASVQINRPFVFSIRLVDPGADLIQGYVADPTATA